MAKKKKQAKRKAASKKGTRKKFGRKKAVNATPDSHAEAKFGWQGTQYIFDLAMDLYSLNPDADSYTAKWMHETAMKRFKDDVFELLLDDIDSDIYEDHMAQLAAAIRFLRTSEGNPMPREGYIIAFEVGEKLKKGELETAPSVAGFRDMLEEAGCPEPYNSGAIRLIEAAGWTPAPGKRGPRSKRKG